MKIELTGKAAQSFIKTLQGPTEPYPDILARLKDAVSRGIGYSEAADILLQSLAFENANPDCQKLLCPLKANGTTLDEYIRACAEVGGCLSC